VREIFGDEKHSLVHQPLTYFQRHGNIDGALHKHHLINLPIEMEWLGILISQADFSFLSQHRTPQTLHLQ
jgi:hypothetical protein